MSSPVPPPSRPRYCKKLILGDTQRRLADSPLQTMILLVAIQVKSIHVGGK